MINFKSTKEDATLIALIVDRVELLHPLGDNRMKLYMDLTACHLNGTPLKLAEMIDMADADFIHDINGIVKHIDRTTGKLGDCFVPRCAG